MSDWQAGYEAAKRQAAEVLRAEYASAQRLEDGAAGNAAALLWQRVMAMKPEAPRGDRAEISPIRTYTDGQRNDIATHSQLGEAKP